MGFDRYMKLLEEHKDTVARTISVLTDALRKQGLPETEARQSAESIVVQLFLFAVEVPEPWEE